MFSGELNVPSCAFPGEEQGREGATSSVSPLLSSSPLLQRALSGDQSSAQTPVEETLGLKTQKDL